MFRRPPVAARWLAAGFVTLLSACGGGGGGSGTAEGSGTLRVALTDAPACGYDHVWVTVEKVRVHQSASASDTDGGWTEIVLAAPKRIDLLTLTNGVLEELGSTTLSPGSYSQVRLVLSANSGSGSSAMANAVQPTGGSDTALATPSGQQSGLKLQAHFTVEAGKIADLVLDFDACKSVVRAGNSGQFILKPVVSVVPRIGSTVQGYVATTSTTIVSAQQNGMTVRATAPDSAGLFSLPFLPAGTYNLVITSEGRATAVVTGVPAGATSTILNTSATPITPPTSTMADATGAVTATTGTGTTTTVALTDATVRATQSLTGGPVIEVKSQAVDSTLGTYSLRLPTAAPVKAPYATTSLTFTADTPLAGKYTLEATAPGRAAQTKPADVSTTNATVNFSY